MNIDTSVWDYFISAGWMVKIVLTILLGASVLSWTIIFRKMFFLKRVARVTHQFEHQFWSGGDLTQLYTDILKSQPLSHGIKPIFLAGFKEFLRLKKQSALQQHFMDNIRRAMHAAQMRETDKLDADLSLLATIGSTSPYIGLFGTVWGIMLSLKALGSVQQATIAMVAPGISEALIATAIGLFAAIPAVIVYNRCVAQIDRIIIRFESFQEEFSNILYRQWHHHEASEVTS